MRHGRRVFYEPHRREAAVKSPTPDQTESSGATRRMHGAATRRATQPGVVLWILALACGAGPNASPAQAPLASTAPPQLAAESRGTEPPRRAEADADGIEQRGELWRLELANDALVRSDNQFTNGTSVEHHSALETALEATSGTLAIGKPLAGAVLPDKPGVLYREGWALGHNIQTPGRLEEPGLIRNDVPYMGMLGWSNTFTALEQHELTGFGLLLGWVGPGTHGDRIQSVLHEVAGHADPQGWRHQLDDEPIANFYYSKRRKLIRRPRFDAALSFNTALGNLFTYAEAGAEMRFGHAPPGFAFVPTRTGRGIELDGRLGEATERAVYGTVAVRATRFLWALPRQGNSLASGNAWTESNELEMEEWTGQLVLGAHFERTDWAVHLHLRLSTDTVRDEGLDPEQDPRNSFGTITIERRL